MSGEIGVHNDAPFVNGMIGVDCGIGGAVTIKELKGLPDCGCGDCNGIVDFGFSEGSPFVALDVENTNLSGKDGSVNEKTVRLSAKGYIDGVVADQKEIMVNGKAKGDDQTGNCVGEDAEVLTRENGVLENGDCDTNGQFPEIEVDAGDGKRRDVVVERNSEEVETKQNDAPFMNGRIGEDCGIGDVVTMKELNGLPDCSCGDCNGIIDFGSSAGSPFVALGVENRNLVRKNGSVNGDTIPLAVKECIDVVSTNRKKIVVNERRKKIVVNERQEGDDQTGNCVGEVAEVKSRENLVPENGNCGLNGRVPEIDVDVVDGKHRDVNVVRNSKEVETKHKDVHFLNGKIGEDCGIGGAVTMKELKNLPDCCCGNCIGIMNFGFSVGSPFVVLGIENSNLVGKDGSVNKDTVPLAVKGCSDIFGTDRMKIVVNGRAEGDDLTGHCVGKDAEVKRQENGVHEIGDCATNGCVLEIDVNVVDGKCSDVVVDGNSEEAETKHNDAPFVNGKIGEDCGIGGAVTMKELKGLPDCSCGDCNVEFGSFVGSPVIPLGIENRNLVGKDENMNGDTVPLAMKGCVDVVGTDRKKIVEHGRMESDDQSGICVSEDVEFQRRENGVHENEDGATKGRVSEIEVDVIEGIQLNVDVERNYEEVETKCGAEENKENGVLETDDINYHSVVCSLSNGVIREESPSKTQDSKVEGTIVKEQNGKEAMEYVDRLIGVGSLSESVEGLSGGVKSHSAADSEGTSDELLIDQAKPGMQEWLSQESSDVRLQDGEKSHYQIQNADKTDAASVVAAVTDGEDIHDQQIESAVQPVPEKEHISESDLCCPVELKPHKVREADVEVLSADDKVEKVEAGDVSVKDVSTAKSEYATEGHRDDASTTVTAHKSVVTLSEVPSSDESKDNGIIVPAERLVASVRDSETLSEKDSTSVDASPCCLADNAGAEAVICFGSFSQREFSDISSEDITEKKEDRHTIPELDIEQSSPQAEIVDVIPQSYTKLTEIPVVGSPKEQTQSFEVDKKAFNYLIKIPRFEDDHLKSKISNAQLLVDEKTKIRDSIKSEMNGKKTIYKESSENFGTAVTGEKAARELLKSKRQDVDLVQNEINKVKNAMSLAEIETEISDMERSIQHETLPLKEERDLVNKIRKLKQLRGQMSSSIGGQDELQKALKNKEETEERLKILKKDADSLRENCLKAEAVTKATKKIYYDDSEKLRELQTRFKEAGEIRQDAYVQLQSLKKELYEKNKPLWKYRDDMKMATDLASKGDRESLSQFCIEQVETFMEAWNKSNEFREEYLQSNARRTLRRLGTAEGRSLGPNEAPIMPPIVNERPAPEKSFPSLATPVLETFVQAVEIESSADKVSINDADKKKRKPKAKNSVKSSPDIEIVLAILEREEIVEKTKEPEVTEEERELARKAEELRKKEEAEKLLEQRRVEEKAKAKEALERKRRNVEKATARAAQKSQKEAEQKEKEREKRAKKKEKKRLGGNASLEEVPEGESHATLEVALEAAPAESDVRDKPAPTRRPAKPSHFPKHSKITPIPAPLRNKGKRKMQPWMWALLAALLVLALFLAGNARNLF